MFMNIVIGKPIVPLENLFAYDLEDWERNERDQTLFTDNRYLPAVLKEAGVVKSANEVRRNRPELNIQLDKLDFLVIKWGKKFVFIVVGE